MKQVTSLPLNAKVLTEEQKTIVLNTALQTLHWTSPLLNPNLGQVEPAAEYKRDGLIAYADGTNWNPISGGKGYYRYDTATSAWVKIEGSGGGSGDMLKSTYDPNTDGVIAIAQLDATVSTFKQTNHDALPNPHHANTNDPSADQKAALAGTSGTPSITNKYVTNDDSRMSVASQAEMEAATDDTKTVTPVKFKYSPSAAKAWVNFNGTGTVAIRSSMNVSSITDNGTGAYTVNLTNAMSDANYCIAGTVMQPGAYQAHVFVPNEQTDTEYAPTTTTFRIGALEPEYAWTDAKYVHAVIYGDQ